MQEKKEEDLQQALNKVFEVGIDEVGRGAVFGPVFAAAVVLTEKNKLILKQFGVTDSKKLTPKKRKLLLPKILLLSSDYGIGQSSAREIDKLGIRVATELSMIRALKKLKEKPSELIIDGPVMGRNPEKHSIWRLKVYLDSFSKHSCQSFSRQSIGEVRKKILRILDISK